MPKRSKKARAQSKRQQFAFRNQRLTELGFIDYSAYIASPLWRKRRTRFFASRERACEICEADQGPMIVHHLFYDRLGREWDSDLVMLCDGCHRLAHKWPHFGPACIRMMRAAWEECGDPGRPIVEHQLNRRVHENWQWRRAKGLPAPARPSKVRVVRLDEMSAEDRARYDMTPRPAASVREFERSRRFK